MSDRGIAKGFDAIWAELRQLLDWQHGFGFYLVFANDQKAANLLRQRVESATRWRTRKLQWVRPTDLQAALEEVMSAALDATSEYNELQSPLWIELSASADDQEWQGKRREILSALNRRRGALEQDCRRPLLLQLPLSMAPEIVTWAPDLWSIRQYIAVLPALSPTPPDAAASAASFLAGVEFADDIDAGPDDTAGLDDDAPASVGEGSNPVLVELRRAAREVERRGELSAADGDPAGALTAFRDSLVLYRRLHERAPDMAHPGLMRSLLRVSDGERDTGNVQLALQLYAEHVALARAGNTGGTGLEQLYALGTGLDRLGRLQSDLGQHVTAESNLRAALDIREQIRAIEGDRIHTLRDVATAFRNLGLARHSAGAFGEALSLHRKSLDLLQCASTMGPEDRSMRRHVAVNLSYLGDVEQSLGNLESTARRRQECLDICRQLAQHDDGAAPLTDLALALDRMGDFHYDSGDIGAARRMYVESLQARRKLRTMLGDTPSVIRSLALCLGQCGYTEQAAGDLAAALAHYRESAALSRQLCHTSEDNPRALRSFAIAKARIASIGMLDGDPLLALAELEECLSLFRRLQAQSGPSPQTLRDLLLTVQRIGRCKLDLGDTDGATAHFDEGVVLARELVARTEGALPPLRDLCRALAHARAADMQTGNIEAARDKQAEVVRLRRDVMARSGAKKDMRMLAKELAEMGAIAEAHGDGSSAIAAYEDSIGLLADDHSRDPQAPEAVLDLGDVLVKAAQQHVMRGDVDPALAHFERAARLFRHVVDMDNHAPEARLGLAVTTIGIGQIQAQRGASAAAIEAFSEAAGLLRAVTAGGDADVLQPLLDAISSLRDLNVHLERTQEAEHLEIEPDAVANRMRPCGSDAPHES